MPVRVDLLADYLDYPRVTPAGAHKGYLLMAPYTFAMQGELVTIPAGFLFDGASIPSLIGLTWAALYSQFDPRVLRAALIHDWFCETRPKSIPSWMAHDQFMRDCISDGAGRRRAWMMHQGIRLGGPDW